MNALHGQEQISGIIYKFVNVLFGSLPGFCHMFLTASFCKTYTCMSRYVIVLGIRLVQRFFLFGHTPDIGICVCVDEGEIGKRSLETQNGFFHSVSG